jgi:hypothetical protein
MSRAIPELRKENHKFEPISHLAIDRKPVIGKRYLWCKKCDSIVLMPVAYNVQDVNKSMDQSKLPCLRPMVGKFA